MKCKALLSASLFTCLLATAQQPSKSGYAIVSTSAGKMSWLNIQEIDLTTGAVNRNIYESDKTRFVLLNGLTKKEMASSETKLSAPAGLVHAGPVRTGSSPAARAAALPAPTRAMPTATMVAAAAYDAKHNQLFFAPLRIGELRWVNLNEKDATLKVYCLPSEALAGGDLSNEARNITRMVIASDGNGYALTNDGNHLTRFTTGKKPVITDLGKLTDDPANNEISIHKRETSWGGDMVADASNNLYIISSYKAVFKVNLNTLTATFTGFIQGMPVDYTTNGAAANSNGEIIISSAQSAEGYYKLDLKTLKAEKQVNMNQSTTSSDLASANFAFQTSGPVAGSVVDRASATKPYTISFFPNPVVQKTFKVRFENNEPGLYDIQMVDLSGKVITEKRVNVVVANQTEDMPVHSSLAKGIYIVKILNGSRKTLSSGEILLQ